MHTFPLPLLAQSKCLQWLCFFHGSLEKEARGFRYTVFSSFIELLPLRTASFSSLHAKHTQQLPTIKEKESRDETNKLSTNEWKNFKKACSHVVSPGNITRITEVPSVIEWDGFREINYSLLRKFVFIRHTKFTEYKFVLMVMIMHWTHKKWGGAFILLCYAGILIVEAFVLKAFGCIVFCSFGQLLLLRTTSCQHTRHACLGAPSAAQQSKEGNCETEPSNVCPKCRSLCST